MTQKRKLTIGVICGGSSVEHEVSLMSARNVARMIQDAGHAPVVIYIHKNGNWFFAKSFVDIFLKDDVTNILSAFEDAEKEEVSINPGKGFFVDKSKLDINVIFPIVHGTGGEDGILQGVIESAGIPYIGCNVASSSIGMDKEMAKIIAKHAGIPVVDYFVARPWFTPDFNDIVEDFTLPFFVKAASLGSSVGVFKVKDEKSYKDALKGIFELDDKALIERAMTVRELECAILGKLPSLKISGVGEVTTTHEFYTYESKYFDSESVGMHIPAKIPDSISEQVREYTRLFARAAGLTGISRVDFFYDEQNNDVYFNEVNTIPGFTAFSMFPVLWKEQGIDSSELINELIQSAPLNT